MLKNHIFNNQKLVAAKQAYKPNINNGSNNWVVGGSKTQSGWLPTPNDDAFLNPAVANLPQNSLTGTLANTEMSPLLQGGVVFNGHNLIVQQDNDPNVAIGKCICTVVWEFKGGKELYDLSY